jgi:glycosyltransferase involved in cell wall biosynthesis
MKISVVTISFNQSKFLNECIESVLNQNYKDFEYIIVDPGSTDGSREIIESYRSRISSIIFDLDSGPADGLNKGFSIATGDIYAFLNADDVFEPGSLLRVAKLFQNLPSVDVIYGHSLVIDSNGKVTRSFYSDHYSLWRAAHCASILSQASTFFRATSFIRAGGFNVKNRIAWDGELFADMALTGSNFLCINEVWSKFRIHGEGITGSGRFHNLHIEYQDYIYKKITGRNVDLVCRIGRIFANLFRKVANPRDTKERLLYGRVAGSVKR